MSQPRVILVNGCPRSGKDTIGLHLAEREGFEIVKFAAALKESAHTLYGMHNLVHYAFEAQKDEPLPEFRGKTPREVYIALSETYFKPLHGEKIFGELLLETMIAREHRVETFVVTDSGFEPEAQVLIDHYGADKCVLVRVHRPGYDFSGDSRNYVELPVKTIDVDNDGSLEKFVCEIKEMEF